MSIAFTLNARPVSIVVSGSVVRIVSGSETLTTAQWSDAEGCHDAYGASLNARTWDAIDAAIRAAR